MHANVCLLLCKTGRHICCSDSRIELQLHLTLYNAYHSSLNLHASIVGSQSSPATNNSARTKCPPPSLMLHLFKQVRGLFCTPPLPFDDLALTMLIAVARPQHALHHDHCVHASASAMHAVDRCGTAVGEQPARASISHPFMRWC